MTYPKGLTPSQKRQWDDPDRSLVFRGMTRRRLAKKIKMGRQYLPTLSELVDRLSIVQLKAIFINEHRDAYKEEIALIEHDIDLLLSERPDYRLSAKDIRAILAIMLTNRFIWENESKARAGGSEQDHLLKLTHSVNGQRNTAKNILSKSFGERLDMKIDALAAELPPELGAWDIFK